MNTRQTYKTSGFTIIELLIVIAVIGILAAITTVSFSTVQTQARATAMAADLQSIEKSYDLYRIATGHYPKSYAIATSSAVLSPSLASKMIEMTGTAQEPCPTTPKTKICVYAYGNNEYSEYALVYWDYRAGHWVNQAIGIGAPDSGDRWRVSTIYGSGEYPVRP